MGSGHLPLVTPKPSSEGRLALQGSSEERGPPAASNLREGRHTPSAVPSAPARREEPEPEVNVAELAEEVCRLLSQQFEVECERRGFRP